MRLRILWIFLMATFVAGFQNPCPIPSQPAGSPFDFDHDDKTDLAVYRPSTGDWWVLNSSTNVLSGARFGLSTDMIVPADYTGDHRTDIAIFRQGTWHILRSDTFTHWQFPFGLPGDIPTPGDFDVNFLNYKVDPAVYRPSEGTWYIAREGGLQIVQFGLSEDRPVVADYNGDRMADIAVYRPSTGIWYVLVSGENRVMTAKFGNATDKLVPADYTGDKKADVAFFRPSTGDWHILPSDWSEPYAVHFGAFGDIPTPGDYDGDSKSDLAVFRPDDGYWYIYGSKQGVMLQKWGVKDDVPAPSAYVK